MVIRPIYNVIFFRKELPSSVRKISTLGLNDEIFISVHNMRHYPKIRGFLKALHAPQQAFINMDQTENLTTEIQFHTKGQSITNREKNKSFIFQDKRDHKYYRNHKYSFYSCNCVSRKTIEFYFLVQNNMSCLWAFLIIKFLIYFFRYRDMNSIFFTRIISLKSLY
ncbi:hypothetical protein TRFO_10730 [Tritrichomonas foetus]|uniref:Uncharacterized protein n=1 Tax=Tritrichomonas foetus TaxID=1144522 RepID=A0A1J4J713_9EUKA|nr:hypothetical protein TRFO_10730 [Tritrichomonas foetus]|eukprot:OHS95022.1 hypothetical protein TRFO_10730 [Tritrichomonas foetus]